MTVGRTSAARASASRGSWQIVQRDILVRGQHATHGLADDGLIVDQQDDDVLLELLLDVAGARLVCSSHRLAPG